MSSILTNASAMTALKTLQQTNKGLETTQSRISTGLRVAQASDNAAYWSIATTMRSDNSAMSTVKDALGLGAAQVDVAYTAMDAVKGTLDKIKSKLVAASQPNVDKGKIQEEINQLKNDLQTFAKSASFSGGNWLDVSAASEEKVVASFIRGADGGISLGTIDIDTSKTALFNSTAPGLLQAKGNELTNGLTADNAGAVAAIYDPAGTNTAGATMDIGGLTAEITLDEGDTLSFDLTFDGETKTVSIVGAAGGTPVNATSIVGLMGTALDEAFGAGKFTTAANTGADGVLITAADPANALGDGLKMSVANLTATPAQIDVLGIDITDASSGELSAYLNGVDRALSAVTTAASDLGAIKSRIDSQQSFVKDLMNAVDRGIGALVDADMNEESTRLQALQVQQQLGIQALSIANGSAQQILSLFR
jgi:flagellin